MPKSGLTRLSLRFVSLALLVLSLTLFSAGATRSVFDFSSRTNQLALLQPMQQKGGANGSVNSSASQDSLQEAATKIVPGQMTEKQKSHSLLYDKEYDLPQRLDLPPDAKGRPQQSDLRTLIGTPLQAFSDTDPPPTLTDVLRNLSCSADAIVLGTVTGKTSQLMNSRQFVFTDYDFVVDEIYKDNASAPIRVSQTITVVRPGGAVEIDGRVVRAIDESYEPLLTDNHYLLFLKYLPKTDSYDSGLPRGSFKVKDNKLIKLTGLWIPGFDSERVGPFIESIRVAIGSSCKK